MLNTHVQKYTRTSASLFSLKAALTISWFHPPRHQVGPPMPLHAAEDVSCLPGTASPMFSHDKPYCTTWGLVVPDLCQVCRICLNPRAWRTCSQPGRTAGDHAKAQGRRGFTHHVLHTKWRNPLHLLLQRLRPDPSRTPCITFALFPPCLHHLIFLSSPSRIYFAIDGTIIASSVRGLEPPSSADSTAFALGISLALLVAAPLHLRSCGRRECAEYRE